MGGSGDGSGVAGGREDRRVGAPHRQIGMRKGRPGRQRVSWRVDEGPSAGLTAPDDADEWPSQAVWGGRTQIPAVRVSPRPMRLRRLSPAVRWVSHALFFTVPR